MNRNTLFAAVMAAALAFSTEAQAQQMEVGGQVYPRPFVNAMGGNAGGLWGECQLAPGTKRLLVQLPDLGTFNAAGIDADTTGPATSWLDTDGAPFTTANLYPYKSVYIKVNSTQAGYTKGGLVFRIQGSATGNSNDWQNILLPEINGGTVLATMDTVQFVANFTGAPFLTGMQIPLQTIVNTSLAAWNEATRPFLMLRIAVINRAEGNSGTINTTTRWVGSQ